MIPNKVLAKRKHKINTRRRASTMNTTKQQEDYNIIESVTELLALIDLGETIESYEPTLAPQWSPVRNWDCWTLKNMKYAIAHKHLRLGKKAQVVDMIPFIENGLDCEFSDQLEFWSVNTLVKIENDYFFAQSYDDDCKLEAVESFKYCRPRLYHPFIWEGQTLPEGLKIEVAFVNEYDQLDWSADLTNLRTYAALRIVGLKDGWVFPGDENNE